MTMTLIVGPRDPDLYAAWGCADLPCLTRGYTLTAARTQATGLLQVSRSKSKVMKNRRSYQYLHILYVYRNGEGCGVRDEVWGEG